MKKLHIIISLLLIIFLSLIFIFESLGLEKNTHAYLNRKIIELLRGAENV